MFRWLFWFFFFIYFIRLFLLLWHWHFGISVNGIPVCVYSHIKWLLSRAHFDVKVLFAQLHMCMCYANHLRQSICTVYNDNGMKSWRLQINTVSQQQQQQKREKREKIIYFWFYISSATFNHECSAHTRFTDHEHTHFTKWTKLNWRKK